MNVQAPIKADQAERLRVAREEAYSTPLKDFHPGAPRLFRDDTLWPWFERLRKEEPVRHLLLRCAAWRHLDQGQPTRL